MSICLSVRDWKGVCCTQPHVLRLHSPPEKLPWALCPDPAFGLLRADCPFPRPPPHCLLQEASLDCTFSPRHSRGLLLFPCAHPSWGVPCPLYQMGCFRVLRIQPQRTGRPGGDLEGLTARSHASASGSWRGRHQSGHQGGQGRPDRAGAEEPRRGPPRGGSRLCRRLPASSGRCHG